MPIAILKIPKDAALSEVDISQAEELCRKGGNCLHEVLHVPDPEDKETRVIRSDSEETVLRIAFTIGPNEYPDFKPKSFFPTEEQIQSAGQSVLEIIKNSPIGVSQVVIEAWKNTTFILREEEIAEPVSPVSEETLKEIGSRLHNPRMKCFISPKTRRHFFFKRTRFDFGKRGLSRNSR